MIDLYVIQLESGSYAKNFGTPDSPDYGGTYLPLATRFTKEGAETALKVSGLEGKVIHLGQAG
jgi:hypothetical protein